MPNKNNQNFQPAGYAPNIETYVCRLLLGDTLSDEELNILAHYTPAALADIALSVTSNTLKELENPKIILNAAAVIYGNITKDLTQDMKATKAKIFQLNLKLIEAKRQKQMTEKGPTR